MRIQGHLSTPYPVYTLSYLLDNINIRFGTKLYRQIVGIPMGTNCAPLVADLFLYCYERDFMDSLRTFSNVWNTMFHAVTECG